MLYNLPEKINKVEILNCNNNCQFCGIKERKNLTTEELKELIKLGKKENDILHFGNGEASIREDFVDLINFGRQLGYQIIQLETNGRIFYYPQFVQKIKDIGIDKLIIKFYSHKKEIHEKISRTLGSFEQTIGGIKNLVKNHKYVAINFNISDLNYQEIPEIVEFLANLKINEIIFQLTDGFNRDILKDVKRAELICTNYGILKVYHSAGKLRVSLFG